jgi:hypothetical protein
MYGIFLLNTMYGIFLLNTMYGIFLLNTMYGIFFLNTMSKDTKRGNQNLGARKPKTLNRLTKIWEPENQRH